MKKHLIYFVLISICIGCNNLQQEDEVISPSEKLQTKTSDHNKHLVTITTNLNEELILFPTIYSSDGISRNEEVVFRNRYVDTLNNWDSFWVMPYPVKGKKWVGIEGDYTAYDTSLDNNAGCPYFEGVINNRDISIHLISEDSIPHTGGNSGSGGVTNPEDKPTEDINPSLILILYYAYTSGCYNNEYDLVFKIHSGLYTPEGIDMNPMYGEPFSITYAFAGQTSKTASLIPKSDHYILKVKVDPTLKDKTLFILSGEILIKKYNYLVKVESTILHF